MQRNVMPIIIAFNAKKIQIAQVYMKRDVMPIFAFNARKIQIVPRGKIKGLSVIVQIGLMVSALIRKSTD